MSENTPIKFEPGDYLVEERLTEGGISFHLYKESDVLNPDKRAEKIHTITFKSGGELQLFLKELGLISTRCGFTEMRKLHDLKTYNETYGLS